MKTWFTLKTYGLEGLGAVITHTCDLAKALADRVDASDELERLAPVALNIVCFRYKGPDSDRLNAGHHRGPAHRGPGRAVSHND